VLKLVAADNRSTRDDWAEWTRRVSVGLLRESPCVGLRACATLAQLHQPLASQLFGAAFLACWCELSGEGRAALAGSLHAALTAPAMPLECLQLLLTLAEFMEAHEAQLPIDARTLGAVAGRCHAYAKALHYKELQFWAEPGASTVDGELIDGLLGLNMALSQRDAAAGLLRYAGAQSIPVRDWWLENLHEWEQALALYTQRALACRQPAPPPAARGAAAAAARGAAAAHGGAREADEGAAAAALQADLGRLRCLHALSEWEQLAALADEVWPRLDAERRADVAPPVAHAQWQLARWAAMRRTVQHLPVETAHGVFCRAMLATHAADWYGAHNWIGKARALLDVELSGALAEGYGRAYSALVSVQQVRRALARAAGLWPVWWRGRCPSPLPLCTLPTRAHLVLDSLTRTTHTSNACLRARVRVRARACACVRARAAVGARGGL
jgi:FKBP12-rapamycin complex-associated protein